MLDLPNIWRRATTPKPQGWHEPLYKAFTRQAAHLHIVDLQNVYLTTSTAHAFFNNGKLARASRKVGIECSWSFWPIFTNTADIISDYPSVQRTLKTPDRFLAPAPKTGEKLYKKNMRSALSNGFFKAHLEGLERPAIILGGLVSDQCYAHTAASILGTLDADLIIPIDASDFTSVEGAKEDICAAAEEKGITIQGRPHYTHAGQVARFIKSLPAPAAV